MPNVGNIVILFLLPAILLYFLIHGNIDAIQAQETTIANHIQNSANRTLISSANEINSNDQSQETTINLLDDGTFVWKPQGYVKVYQTNGGLDMYVDAMNKWDKTYNRAFLQTQINSTEPTLFLLLDYSFKSINGNASLALEIRNKENNNVLSSLALSKDSTYATFPLTATMTKKPIELRLYVITDEPGFHILNTKQVLVLADPMAGIQLISGRVEKTS